MKILSDYKLENSASDFRRNGRSNKAITPLLSSIKEGKQSSLRRTVPLSQFLTVVFMLCACVLGSKLRAREFRVDGELTYTIYQNGQIQKTIRKTFRVQVLDCVSLYRSYDVDKGYYIEVQSDGDSLYEVGSFPSTTNGVTTNKVSGFVEKRKLPRDDSSNINYLWLAYGSGCYFEATTNDMIDALWVLDNPKRDPIVKANWSIRESEWLPRQVTYLSDGHWHTLTPKGEALDAPMPRPFDKGFTNAIYRVLNITNFYNNFIPTEFVFTRFGVRPFGKTAVIEKLTETHGVVSFVGALSPSANLLPSFDGVVRVVDTRFKIGSPIETDLTYLVTNGNWKAQ